MAAVWWISGAAIAGWCAFAMVRWGAEPMTWQLWATTVAPLCLWVLFFAFGQER